MLDLSDGVSGYVWGTAQVAVHFPIDNRGNADICCKQCFLYRESSNRCALNYEVCEYPTKYRGSNCPLTIIENSNDKEKEN